MKNIIYLIFILNLIILNNLNAQLETIKSNNLELNLEVPPLSINAFSSDKFDEFKNKYQSLNAKFQTNSCSNFNTQIKLSEPSNFKRQTSNFNLSEPSDSFDKKRFWTLLGTGATIHTGALILLNKVWYAQYPRSAFHYFDDKTEWMEIDKAGHILTAYTATKWAYNAVRWSGMKNKNATLVAMSTGMLFQTSLEVLDGFSTEWGFSWADMLSNTSGCALFGFQQAIWEEQRIILKISNTQRNYSTTPIRSTDGLKTSSLRERANDLYGDNYTQTFFKDYNALTFWLSFNPHSFNKNGRFPTWLNIAIGYGADNMFGGYNNQWPTAKPEFILSNKDFPRYRQLYVSLDIDLSRIKTKSKLLNTVLRTINFIKIPSPTLEFNSLNQIKFHPLFF
jgi:hypothetical protein